MSIAIVGIGAIGSVIASSIKKDKRDRVSFINRSSKSSIRLQNKDEEIEIPIQTKKIDQVDSAFDWVIFCIKEYHYKEIAPSLGTFIGESTKIAVIRNGLDHKAPFLHFKRPDSIVVCQIDCPVQPHKHKGYIQYAIPKIYTQSSELATEFSKLFDLQKLRLHQLDDYHSYAWQKLIESASLGAILALTQQTCIVFDDLRMVDLFKNLANEAIKIARADGANVNDGFVEDLYKKLLGYPSEKGSSMLTDRLAGRPIELDAKNGVIVSKAMSHNISCPLHTLVCNLLSQDDRIYEVELLSTLANEVN